LATFLGKDGEPAASPGDRKSTRNAPEFRAKCH